MECLEGELGAAFVSGAHGEHGTSLVGREVEFAAKFEFLLAKAIKVMASSVLDAGCVRGAGLNEDFAFQFAASGASGDLGEELEGALGGAEVGDVETDVGVENAYQGDVGEVEAFGNHLSTYEDVDFFRFEGEQGIAQGVFFAHDVGIDAGEAGFWEEFGKDFFDLLSAIALEGDAGVKTTGAFAGDDGLVTANMAHKPFICAMVGERKGAVWAMDDMTAGMALQ